MKQISTKDIQAMKLELLSTFQNYCKNNGLTFYMAYGSLIGCVREHGFIPWDEDIDLYMMRDDFNKLLNAKADALGGLYFIQNYKTDPNFYVPMIRLCINGTYRCEEGLEKCNFNKGTFIDVFPLDSAPNDEELREKHYKKVSKYFSLLRLKASTLKIHDFRSFLMCCIRFIIKPISFVTLNKRAMKIMQRYNNQNCSYLISISAVYGGKRESYKKEWFEEITYLDFEKISVPCPKGYDALLTHVYGNYMLRPSEGSRKIDCPSFYID